LSYGELFDGRDAGELLRYVFHDDEPRAPLSAGSERMLSYLTLAGVSDALRRPQQMREELAVMSPDHRPAWESQIAEAEAKSAKLRAEYGIAPNATDQDAEERLIECAIEDGLRPPEVAKLRQVTRQRH
jgi:hypothetical protein